MEPGGKPEGRGSRKVGGALQKQDRSWLVTDTPERAKVAPNLPESGITYSSFVSPEPTPPRQSILQYQPVKGDRPLIAAISLAKRSSP